MHLKLFPQRAYNITQHINMRTQLKYYHIYKRNNGGTEIIHVHNFQIASIKHGFLNELLMKTNEHERDL